MSDFLHKKTKSKSREKRSNNNNPKGFIERKENICKAIRCTAYVICLSLALLNSWAIFQSYTSDTKVRSTKVVPSAGNVLDSPTILICNSSAYKNEILPTTKGSYKENTMNLSDILVDALLVKDARKGSVLGYRPKSIKEKLQEVETMFQGTCIILEETIQVK